MNAQLGDIRAELGLSSVLMSMAHSHVAVIQAITEEHEKSIVEVRALMHTISQFNDLPCINILQAATKDPTYKQFHSHYPTSTLLQLYQVPRGGQMLFFLRTILLEIKCKLKHAINSVKEEWNTPDEISKGHLRCLLNLFSLPIQAPEFGTLVISSSSKVSQNILPFES